MLFRSAERLEPVAPADLLALLVGPAGVADRHLEDARLPLGELDGQLRLEPEVVGEERVLKSGNRQGQRLQCSAVDVARTTVRCGSDGSTGFSPGSDRADSVRDARSGC